MLWFEPIDGGLPEENHFRCEQEARDTLRLFDEPDSSQIYSGITLYEIDWQAHTERALYRLIFQPAWRHSKIYFEEVSPMEHERQAALSAAHAASETAYSLCKAMNSAEKTPFRATIAAAQAATEATLAAAQAAEDAALAIDADQAELEPDLMYAHTHAMRTAEAARQYANLKIADLELITGANPDENT
jgi:hypothetical protein